MRRPIRWESVAVAEIVRLDRSQWRRLRELRLRALADAPDAFGSTLAAEEAQREATWVAWLERGPWWVAADEGGDVGLVAGGHRRDLPWVFSMWVDPARRGSGIAAALLDAVVDWASGLGAAKVGLDVTDRAPTARRAYLRYGFVPTGVTERLDRDPSIVLEELVFTLERRPS